MSAFELDHLSEVKLHRPAPRASWVHRPRLVDAMVDAIHRPVTLVAAPAGYGKTTAVAQGLQGDECPASAWVSLDAGDNDPVRLWSHVAAALERSGCVLPVVEPARVLGRRAEPAQTLLLTIMAALAAMPDDLVLVLDDFHFVQSTARHEEVELLVQSLPERAHLVIVSRSDPGLRLGRLRVSADLAELRAEDLAFTPGEAREMFARTGVVLADETLAELVERTEGWPAALYLAVLSLADRPDPDDFVHRFSGSNRFIGDYLIEEVLSRQPDRLRDFIMDVSVLDRFSAALCDHLLGRSDSATILNDLERANLFLVPLDGGRTWYRFHQLFAAVARSELELSRPRHVEELHVRAAEWFSTRGLVSEAITHWLAAGRTQETAELVQGNWLRFVDAGQGATVHGWLDSLGPGDRSPPARVTAAWMAGLVGDEQATARHLHALEGMEDYGPLPDGSRSVESAMAQMRAWFGFGGPLDMMAAARRAARLETNGQSAQYVIAQATLGHAHYVLGELDQAVPPLRAAIRSDGAPGMIRILALSLECFVETERGNVSRARECAELAMDVLDSRGLGAAPQASWAYVALAQAQADAGKSDDAMRTLELGLSTRWLDNAQAVWGPIHHLTGSSRLAARLGHTALAQDLLTELTQRMGRFTEGMAAMHARADIVRGIIRDHDAPEVIGEPLTTRELDVLRLMQGSLSLHEISVELYLSANTVKTHARAVYRKLGAHSRDEAVMLARQQSLI
jgi:LuxR family transcriptional regulator, maltose regulon positive regulatory protein